MSAALSGLVRTRRVGSWPWPWPWPWHPALLAKTRLYTISGSGWASVNSTAWIGLVGALGGVTPTGLIGLLTAMLNHRLLAAAAEQDRRFRTADRLYDL